MANRLTKNTVAEEPAKAGVSKDGRLRRPSVLAHRQLHSKSSPAVGWQNSGQPFARQ